jgi:hypothetical protein
MTNYCFVLPFLPGGIDLAKKFAQEMAVLTRNMTNSIKVPVLVVNRFGFNVVHQVVVHLISR